MQSSSPYFHTVKTPCGQVMYGHDDKSMARAREHAQLRLSKHKKGCKECKDAETKRP